MTYQLNITISKSSSSRLGLYRILTDLEFPPYLSRTAQPGWQGNPSTPATCHFDVNQASQVQISSAASALVFDLNDPLGNFAYVTGGASGWANAGKFPWVTPLGFEDNFLDILDIDDSKGRAQFRTWSGERDDPAVIHRWRNINYNGSLFDAHNGNPGYIVLDYPDPCYVDLDRIVKV